MKYTGQTLTSYKQSKKKKNSLCRGERRYLESTKGTEEKDVMSKDAGAREEDVLRRAERKMEALAVGIWA